MATTQELLPLATEGNNASTVSAVLTPSLVRLLLEASNADMAAADLARRPQLLHDARISQKRVARLAGPCGPDAVYVALQPALILYGPPDFGKGKAADMAIESWITIYKTALGKLPLEALEYAVSVYIERGSGHPASRVKFPMPAELNALADKKAAELRTIAWRLKVGVEKAAHYAPRSQMTDEERAEGKRVLAETFAMLKGMQCRATRAPRESPQQMAERIRQAVA